MRIQQAVSNFTASAQVGPWLRFDYYETPFNLTLLVSLGTGASMTLGIDYIADDFGVDGQRQVFITQATTTITVNDSGPTLPSAFGGGLGHGLAVGDAVDLTGTPGGSVDGIYSVASVTSDLIYTLTYGVSQTLAGANATVSSGRILQGTATDKVIPLAPVTARTSVVALGPICAARLHVTAFTTGGHCALVGIQGGVSS